MIAVIDYKAGNLTSVVKALRTLTSDVTVTADAAVLKDAKKIILPGVGHFQATRLLDDTGITAAVGEAIRRGIPFLGICVGLQWLYSGSTEAPGVPGLGIFPEECQRFEFGVKVPHVGWNSVHLPRASKLLKGVPDAAFFYYTHSYRPPVSDATIGVTDYGGPFTGAVEQDNVMGVQFHPEKSGESGLQLLRNFLDISC